MKLLGFSMVEFISNEDCSLAKSAESLQSTVKKEDKFNQNMDMKIK